MLSSKFNRYLPLCKELFKSTQKEAEERKKCYYFILNYV